MAALSRRIRGRVRRDVRRIREHAADSGRRALAALSVSSKVLGPPKGLVPKARDWFESNRTEAGETPPGFYEIHASETLNRSPPTTADGRVPWQFQGFYGGFRSTEPPAFILEIPRGRVLGAGAVITPDDLLLGDVSREQIPGNDQTRHSAFKRWKLPPLVQVAGRVAVLAVPSSGVYWHWMFDLLPRILLLSKLSGGLSSIDRFVVNPLDHEFQRETLKQLGLPPDKLIVADSQSFHIEADRLLVTSVVKEVPSPWACADLRRELLRGLVPQSATRRHRLYISRADAGSRRVVNEEQVETLLSEYGFTCLTLSGLSAREQAELFESAEIVIAPHGSGLTNLLYCRPGTKVLEFFAPSYLNPCYWVICNHLRLPYYCSLGAGVVSPPPPSEVDPEQWFFKYMKPDPEYGNDILVDMAELATLLNQIAGP